MKRCIGLLVLCIFPAFGQSNYGELHLHAIDPSGLAVKTTVDIVSEGNQYRRNFTSDDQGALVVQHLPYGVYQVELHAPGFADASESVDIGSGIPVEKT